MLEAQSRVDRLMPMRMCRHVLGWYELLMEAEGLAELPPIIAAVIDNGEQPWDAETRLSEMIAVPPVLRDSGFAFDQYVLVDERRLYERGELAEAVRQQEGEPMVVRTTLADFEQQMRQRGIDEGLRRGIDQGRQQGMDEGRQQGMQDSKREFARLLVGDGKSEQEVQCYTGLSVREIREIRRNLPRSDG